MFVNFQIIFASLTLRNFSFLPCLKTSDASYFDFLDMSGDFFPLSRLSPGSSFVETWLPAHQLIRSLLFMTDCTAGCNIQGFFLAFYLPFPGPAREQTEGRTLASQQPAPGVPEGRSLIHSYRDAICSMRRSTARSRGRARGRGVCRQRAREVFRPAVLSLVPRFPGRDQPAEPASDHSCFARLVISCSFSQHKKCNCTVPPTQHSSYHLPALTRFLLHACFSTSLYLLRLSLSSPRSN